MSGDDWSAVHWLLWIALCGVFGWLGGKITLELFRKFKR